MGRRWVDGYSSDVEVYLMLDDGRKLDVAQFGNGSLVLREPIWLPEMLARVVIAIDGDERVIGVVLYRGADSKDPRVVYEKRRTPPRL